MGRKAARPGAQPGAHPGKQQASRSGAWLAGAVAVALVAWVCLRSERPALAARGVEDDLDEADVISEKFGAVRARLFNQEGGSNFDRSANATRTPSTGRNFSDASYWDNRYSAGGEERRYDWYGVWDSPGKVRVKPHVLAAMPPAGSPVLNIGCGNSRFPEELHDDGYSNLMNIDISQVVVDRMARQLGGRKGLSFQQMDATSMSFQDGSFAAVFEKGTLDALYTASAEMVRKTVAEVFRTLLPGGAFISVTFGQPSARTELNATGSSEGWASFSAVVLDKDTGNAVSIEEAEGDNVYIYVMTKAGVGS